jgi:hypothetical protein
MRSPDGSRIRFSEFSAVEWEKIVNGTIELYAYIFSSLLRAELTQKQGVAFTYLARAMLVLPNPTIHTLREFIEDGERFRPYIDRLEGTASHSDALETEDPVLDGWCKIEYRPSWFDELRDRVIRVLH